MPKINASLLNVVIEISLVNTTIIPDIFSRSLLFVFGIESSVNLRRICCRHPLTVVVSIALLKMAYIGRAISPEILAFSLKFIFWILPEIFISISKNFDPKAILEVFFKMAFIKTSLKLKITHSFHFIASPLPLVVTFFTAIIKLPFSIPVSIDKLSLIKTTIIVKQHSFPILFSNQKLAFVKILTRKVLEALPWFLILLIVPLTNIKFAGKVPYNTKMAVIWQLKHNAILKFFEGATSELFFIVSLIRKR